MQQRVGEDVYCNSGIVAYVTVFRWTPLIITVQFRVFLRLVSARSTGVVHDLATKRATNPSVVITTTMGENEVLHVGSVNRSTYHRDS